MYEEDTEDQQVNSLFTEAADMDYSYANNPRPKKYVPEINGADPQNEMDLHNNPEWNDLASSLYDRMYAPKKAGASVFDMGNVLTAGAAAPLVGLAKFAANKFGPGEKRDTPRTAFEKSQWLMERMGEYNVGITDFVMDQAILERMPKDTVEAFFRAKDMYNSVPPTERAFFHGLKTVVSDPVTYLGLYPIARAPAWLKNLYPSMKSSELGFFGRNMLKAADKAKALAATSPGLQKAGYYANQLGTPALVGGAENAAVGFSQAMGEERLKYLKLNQPFDFSVPATRAGEDFVAGTMLTFLLNAPFRIGGYRAARNEHREVQRLLDEVSHQKGGDVVAPQPRLGDAMTARLPAPEPAQYGGELAPPPVSDMEYVKKAAYRGWTPTEDVNSPRSSQMPMGATVTDVLEGARAYGEVVSELEKPEHVDSKMLFLGDREQGRLKSEMSIDELEQHLVNQWAENRAERMSLSGRDPDEVAAAVEHGREQVKSYLESSAEWQEIWRDADITKVVPVDQLMEDVRIGEVVQDLFRNVAWRSRLPEGVELDPALSSTTSYDPSDNSIVSHSRWSTGYVVRQDVDRKIPTIPSFEQLESRYREAAGVPRNVVTRSADAGYIDPEVDPFRNVGGGFIRPHKVWWREPDTGQEMFMMFRYAEEADRFHMELERLSEQGAGVTPVRTDMDRDELVTSKPWFTWQVTNLPGPDVVTRDTFYAQELMLQNPDAVVTPNYDIETQHLHSLNFYSSMEKFMVHSKKLQTNGEGKVNAKSLYELFYDKDGTFKGSQADQNMPIKKSDAELYEIDKYLNEIIDGAKTKADLWVPKADVIDYMRSRWTPIEKRVGTQEYKWHGSDGPVGRALVDYERRRDILEDIDANFEDPEYAHWNDDSAAAGIWSDRDGDYLYEVSMSREINEDILRESLQEDFDQGGMRDEYITERISEYEDIHSDELEAGTLDVDDIQAMAESDADNWAEQYVDDLGGYDRDEYAEQFSAYEYMWETPDTGPHYSNSQSETTAEAYRYMDEWLEERPGPEELEAVWGIDVPAELADSADVKGRLGPPELTRYTEGETPTGQANFAKYAPNLRGEYGPRMFSQYYIKHPGGEFPGGRNDLSSPHYNYHAERDGVQMGHARSQIADVIINGEALQYFYYLHEIQSDFFQQARDAYYGGKMFGKYADKVRDAVNLRRQAHGEYNRIVRWHENDIEYGRSISLRMASSTLDSVNARMREAGVETGVKPIDVDSEIDDLYILYPKADGKRTPALEDRLMNYNRLVIKSHEALRDFHRLADPDIAYADVPYKDTYHHIMATDQLRTALQNETNGFAMSRGAAHYMGQNASTMGRGDDQIVWHYNADTDTLRIKKYNVDYDVPKSPHHVIGAIVDRFGVTDESAEAIANNFFDSSEFRMRDVFEGSVLQDRARFTDRVDISSFRRIVGDKKFEDVKNSILERALEGKSFSGMASERAAGMGANYNRKYREAVQNALREAGVPKKLATLKDGTVTPTNHMLNEDFKPLMVFVYRDKGGVLRVATSEDNPAAISQRKAYIQENELGEGQRISMVDSKSVSYQPTVSYIQFKDENGEWVHESFKTLHERIMNGESIWKLSVGGAIAVGLTAAEKAQQEQDSGT